MTKPVIVTRAGKGSPLTHTEVDSNFTNLNTDKVEASGGTLTNPTINGTVTTTGLNFDSNTLVIDATNNYVGVGVATPNAPLSFAAATGSKLSWDDNKTSLQIGTAPNTTFADALVTATKNVNSLRSIERALTGEIIRQAELLEKGEKVKQETRHFLEDTGLTRPGRSKEQAEDYRYFPEPDLIPVAPDANWISDLKIKVPEKPSIHRKRLQEAWQVPDKEMAALINSELLNVVEETVNVGADPTRARTWWLGEISRLANEKDVPADSLISPTAVAEIISLIVKGELTDKLARQVVEGVINGEGNPTAVIQSRGLKVVSDDGALMKAIEDAIAAQPDTAERVRGGNIPAAGALIGAVMKATGGQADAARVRELLLKHLGQG